VRADDVTKALDIGHKWTRQVKAEERSVSARTYRTSMWTGPTRIPLKEICYEHMEEAWAKASDDGRLPTYWRQVFYVMRPLCDAHPDADRPLRDTTFKNILEDYLSNYRTGWDVLRGARGVFKEPHAAENDHGLAMSTLNVRDYLRSRPSSAHAIPPIAMRFPTAGAENRIAAVLICEKEGFDELLNHQQIPAKYDLALMSTKGISAIAARDLAEGLGIPCFTLHDMDKNGFVMAAGFPFATDIGIHLADVHEWNLTPEHQHHRNTQRTIETLLRNGASTDEARYIASGQRVELNMLTSPDFVAFVERKLQQHGVEKVIPGRETLEVAWNSAHVNLRVNKFIERVSNGGTRIPPMPSDLEQKIRDSLTDHPAQSWDEALWTLIDDGGEDDEE
jgi:hypothetical protein